jgi:hypothetical protein
VSINFCQEEIIWNLFYPLTQLYLGNPYWQHQPLAICRRISIFHWNVRRLWFWIFIFLFSYPALVSYFTFPNIELSRRHVCKNQWITEYCLANWLPNTMPVWTGCHLSSVKWNLNSFWWFFTILVLQVK